MAKVMTIPQRAEAKTAVTGYYIKGMSTRKIAERITADLGRSVSHQTVQVLIGEIIADMRADYKDKIEDLLFVNLEKYNQLEAEMWEAWELSKQVRRKATSRRKGSPIMNANNNTIRSVKTEEIHDSEELTDGRGDPRYATIILECIEKRMEWLFRLNGGKLDTGGGTVINNTNNNVTLVIRPAERIRSPKMLQLEAEQAKLEQQDNTE